MDLVSFPNPLAFGSQPGTLRGGSAEAARFFIFWSILVFFLKGNIFFICCCFLLPPKDRFLAAYWLPVVDFDSTFLSQQIKSKPFFLLFYFKRGQMLVLNLTKCTKNIKVNSTLLPQVECNNVLLWSIRGQMANVSKYYFLFFWKVDRVQDHLFALCFLHFWL